MNSLPKTFSLPATILHSLVQIGIYWLQHSFIGTDTASFTNEHGVLDRDKWDYYLSLELPIFLSSKDEKPHAFSDHLGNTEYFARGWAKFKHIRDILINAQEISKPLISSKNIDFVIDPQITFWKVCDACFGHLAVAEPENCFFKICHKSQQLLPNAIQECISQGLKHLDGLPIKPTFVSVPETRTLSISMAEKHVNAFSGNQKNKHISKYVTEKKLPLDENIPILKINGDLLFIKEVLPKICPKIRSEITIRRHIGTIMKKKETPIHYDSSLNIYWILEADQLALCKCNPLGRPRKNPPKAI